MDITQQFLALVSVVLLTYGFYRLRQQFRFWADRNVPHLSNKIGFMDKSLHPVDHFQKWYKAFKGQYPMMGMLMLVKPIGVALDLELIKCIMVKDFQFFQNRGTYFNERDDPISAHLFSLEGAKWRSLRAKISPTFTSGKMKMMYPTMVAAGRQFSDYLDERVTPLENELEMKDLLSRFTTDMIGTCAFGIECNTLEEPNSKFREMGRKHFEAPRSALKDAFKMTAPNLARFLRVKEILPDVSEFFMGVVRDTIDYRLKNDVRRNDFMDLLIAMMNNSSESDRITFNEIAAQAYVFFIAGFETSSTTMTWALYELSLNQDVQEKGRSCVREVLERHNGLMSYEAIMEMTYLDQIINETLRKYPPVPIHFRTTTKEYRVPGTDTLLPAGIMMMLPVHAIQHDPEIFPNPEMFDPDRFTAEEINKRHPFAWIPFGEGPRICIGLRFGMMQARIGLALLLNSFRFSTGSKSTIPLEFEPTNFILSPKQGLWLKVDKIQHDGIKLVQ